MRAKCLQPLATLLQMVTGKALNKWLGVFLPPSTCVPFTVLLSFLHSLLFLPLACPSKGCFDEQRAPTGTLPPQNLPGLEHVSGWQRFPAKTDFRKLMGATDFDHLSFAITGPSILTNAVTT